MQLRYERKYLVANNKLEALRKAVAPFVRADLYAAESKVPHYTVRSIYFDSIFRDSVFEKIEGLRDRKKLRVRGYNMETDDSIVFLEIKRKISNRICKNRAQIKYRDLEALLQSGDYEQYLTKPDQRSKDDAARFLFNYNRYNMEPVNLIVYHREPYHGIFDPGVRITFDKHIRSRIHPQMDELFDDVDFVYPWAGHFILEVKYFNAPMPSWMKSIVREFDLKAEALSKYVEGFNCHPLAY